MVRRSLSHGLRAWLAVVGGFSLRMMGRFLCVAWSAFGLVSVTIVRFGCECVAQSPWAEAEAEVDVAGGVVHISVVSHTSCVVRG